MKTFLTVTCIATLCLTSLLLAQTPATQPTAEIKAPATQTQPANLASTEDRIAYFVGVNIGMNLKRQRMEITNYDAFVAGIKDAASGGKLQLADDEMQQVYMALMQQQQTKMREYQERMAAQAETNKKEGEEFLAKNKEQPGVKVTPSGLQYKVLQEGTGASPKPTDTVMVRYRGTLISGKEFDAQMEEPFRMDLQRVIPAWQEALPMMKEGAKWMLYVPSNLAYGAQPAGEDIGPNSTLIFEIELVDVIEQPAPATMPGAATLPRPAATRPAGD